MTGEKVILFVGIVVNIGDRLLSSDGELFAE
jgi:hypothetical protein